MKTVRCPTCGKKVPWEPDQRFRPFCSERCKLIDLGAWADESHRIPGEEVNPWQQEPPEDSGLH